MICGAELTKSGAELTKSGAEMPKVVHISYEDGWDDHQKMVAFVSAIAACLPPLPQRTRRKAKDIRADNRQYNRMHNGKRSKRRMNENAKD